MSDRIAKTLLFNTISDALEENAGYRELRKILYASAGKTAPGHIAMGQGSTSAAGMRKCFLRRNSLLNAVLAKTYKECGGRMMLVFPTEQDAQICAGDLESWHIPCTVLPWWQSYRPLQPGDGSFGQRSLTLSRAAHNPHSLILLSLRAFLTAAPPPQYIKKFQISIKVGEKINPIAVAEQLSRFGYLRVPKVHLHGEFALRGEVLDVFLTGDEVPVRVSLEYDVVDQIRSIDPMSQRSQEYVPEILLYPACEIVWDEQCFAALRTAYPQFKDYALSIAYEDIEQGKHTRGEERIYPFIFPGSYPADYLQKKQGDMLAFIDPQALMETEKSFRKEYADSAKKLRLPPYEKTHAQLTDYQNSVYIHTGTLTDNADIVEHIISKDGKSYFGHIDMFREEARNAKERGEQLIVCAGNELQARRVTTLIHDESIHVVPQNISSGFHAPELKLFIVAEHELFGRKQVQTLRASSSEQISSFTDLDVGDYVVHIMHGIGRFKGIARMTVSGRERDYIHLEYADDEFLYVPIEQVNMVQRYIGYDTTEPRLDRLGSKGWQQRKARVRAHVEELAERLVRLYSKRQVVQGFAFAPDSEWQLEFESGFPYTETADQLKCINDVKADMESPQPMDRLICGDVGFGKTEVALRAAFKAITNGKQVAILAPTTILVEQHYELIIKRMRGFPVKAAMLSRFVTRKEQKRIIAELHEGTIDLVVGTHRLIESDVGFKDLGLIILDEEQRFGVKAKETLKELKTSIDCLTMTATPIPRTLHMSLMKIRSISFIRTAPMNRKAIHTYVDTFDREIIASAIKKELARGGQIYYLHNRIQTLERARNFLEKLIPEAIVETVHGQMQPRELEDRIHRFMHQGSNVLITTTIIENGIDIPNVNTIIIDRADLYGIAQLYQLRGRVGRSERQSYAYLLYPSQHALSDLARKRLETIADNTELGSGFQIALRDMEVRGTGNILGSQQSGNILAVGFDLYLQLLQEAIHRIREQPGEELKDDLHLELEYSGYIPDSYIPDPSQKIDMYKRIASVNTTEELERLRQEMTERFGHLPEEAQSLLALSDIRILCKSLSITSLRERNSRARIAFGAVSVISPAKIARLIAESQGEVSVDAGQANVLIVRTRNASLSEKSRYISSVLKKIL